MVKPVIKCGNSSQVYNAVHKAQKGGQPLGTLMPQAIVLAPSGISLAPPASPSIAYTAPERLRDVRLLRVGSRGPDVASVQRKLGITADGIFGPKTRAAVRSVITCI